MPKPTKVTLAQLASPKLIPLDTRLLISPPPEQGSSSRELQSVGGILIPESGAAGKNSIEAYYVADVLAAGEACKVVKKGDRVIAARPVIWEVKIDGKVLGTFIREADVHGAIRG